MGKRLEKISTKLKIGVSAPKSILNNKLKVPVPPPCAFLIWRHNLPIFNRKFAISQLVEEICPQFLHIAPNRGFRGR